MRFRTAGANWERRPWTLAPCLVVLGQQISVLHPRGHPADGTVASRAHDAANPSSDHRPKPYSGSGIVRALDAGENTEDDAYNMAESIRLSRDPRISYVIHEGRLFSSYTSSTGVPPFVWRPYRGAPHTNHLHVSTLAAYDNDVRPWSITLEDDMTPDQYRTLLREELDRRTDGRAGPANRFQGIGESVVNTNIGATGPSGNPPPWNVGLYLRRTFDQASDAANMSTAELQTIAKAVNDELARRQAE